MIDDDTRDWTLCEWPPGFLHPLDAAWIAQLDVELELAQAMLRTPLRDRPWPEGATVSKPRSEPPPPPTYFPPRRRQEQPSGPRPQTLVAPEGRQLTGAYARRKAAMENQPPTE